MDIGGSDIVINVGWDTIVFSLMRAAILRHWPDAVIEIEYLTRPIPLKEMEYPEMIVYFYANRDSFVSWMMDGATKQNEDKMIMVTAAEFGRFTLTFDEGARRIIEEIQAALKV